MASVARVGSDEADGAVQMLAVKPTGEGFHPSLRTGLSGKPLRRPIRAVFSGSKQRFREWIVVADPGQGNRVWPKCLLTV